MAEQLRLENQLCFRLYRLNKRMTKMYAPLLKGLGLTYPQYLVMLVLWQEAPNTMSVKALGKKLELDSGTLSPLLKRMQSQGLIDRIRSEEDERSVAIGLTEFGASLESKALDIPISLFSQTGLSETEFSQLTSLLDKLIATTQT
ncbi:MarR family transcriptional regulator [Thalassotalea sp. LPB0316]|uniref:MarR family winged helix-turn-helix transcriptional regulator n=1 Tax=Thalassotalea sp. LPB0316 TaxID=2769490 RepID=UPI0018694024|nr:MarR family transcriptional regulator [Thalassotalea sp. LPB0316]QOL24645.1 MarR family transcriptional regulator [Thalassotalea sp. LPB0316]